MSQIKLKTLCIAIKALQVAINLLKKELEEYPDADGVEYLQLDLFDHDRAADELKELYIAQQQGVINFPTYDELIKE